MKAGALVLLLLSGALGWAGEIPAPPPGAEQDPEGVDFFERKIRPLLAQRCAECHSARAEKLKGHLRLDTVPGIRKGGDQGAAVVPGDPDRSLLVQAVRWSQEELRMPPKKKLSAEEISDLEAWVRRGAPLPEAGDHASPGTGADPRAARSHWAFQPLRKPPRPVVRHAGWVSTPVDEFILAKLEEKGLLPSGPADPRTLLRRVTYDLVGLPPSPEEVEAFLADPSPDAYRRQVERLLASPHYGERWGRHWLDVARYADTKGYVYGDREESRFIHSWTYRDWVVRAFNDDLPYDRFLMLQLAADGLAKDDPRDLAAMGFLTVGRRFINNIHDIIDDRLDTLARGMMGLTLSCARCHDHKFDPIPTADYYSLYGVFQGSAESILPLAPAAGDPGQAFLAELEKREGKLKKFFETKRQELLERLRTQVPLYLAAATEIEKQPTEDFYQNLEPGDVNPVIARAWHSYLFRFRKEFHPIFAPWHALGAMSPEELPAKFGAWLAEHRDRLNPRVAQALGAGPIGNRKDLALRYGELFVQIHRDWKEAVKEKEGEKAFSDPSQQALRQVIYGDDSPIALPPGAISEVEWFFDEGTRVSLAKMQRAIDQLILDSPGAPPYAAILRDRPIQQNPRVFRRGNPAQKGEEIPRQFLGFLSPGAREPFGQGSGRLELARSIASPQNPLTARVLVNRLWLNHFGAGLVRTPSDFGLRSEPPSHPELLDDLACRFIESGWSVKEMHRLIVLSSAYRQSSQDHPQARALDPENRLLWRASPRRLDFEEMRDSFLFVSGQLDGSLGGRPGPLSKAPFERRRALYGFIDRLNVPTVLRAFDFASVDAHSPQRYFTTVPQQALFLLNSPFLEEQARALAARSEIAGARDPEERLRQMIRRVFGRTATPREIQVGLDYVAQSGPPPVARAPSAWSYGYGEVDEKSGTLKSFTPLPYFNGTAWQGGPAYPDPALGWIQITASGGHAGNDYQHATVRRWTAPREGQIQISGTIAHKQKGGNGVRARLLTSRQGELGTWILKQLESEIRIKSLEVRAGDTVDFVVDYHGDITDDEFVWAPLISMLPAGAAAGGDRSAPSWNAAAEFGGPPARPLGAWERLAQDLLISNEFFFLD